MTDLIYDVMHVRQQKAVESIRGDSKKTQLKTIKPKLKLINSGCTLLNLACSDNIYGAYPSGTMIHLAGDSSSGKSILALTTFAEQSKRKAFNNYEFIYDDVEAANAFDMSRLFGKEAARRIIAPRNDEPSSCIEDFQANILRFVRKEKPFIYVEDSFDALTSDMEVEKADKAAEARDAGREAKGSMGMEKAKIGGQILRMVCRKIKKTESLLMIISQIRDNTDPMSMQKRTVSGGRALKFYASLQIWLSLGEKIKSRDRVIGVTCMAKIMKNKITGKLREVEFPIYYDYGVDDIGACIDFLIKEKAWKKDKSSPSIVATGEIEFTGPRAKLISHIETNGLEQSLREEVGRVWNEIEESLRLRRKMKYEE